jgi:RHS repeat-associated protein
VLNDYPASVPSMGVTYYGYRWMDPVTGRWPSRDPIGERGGVNLHGFVRNNGVSLWDFIGLNVYVIDGTNFNVRDNPHQDYSNPHDIHQRADNGSEASRYYGGPGSESKGVLNLGVLAGRGIGGIIDDVVRDICSDYCKDRSININLFGWSRGAIAAVEVATKLNNDGCKCARPGGVVVEKVCVDIDEYGNETWETWESIVGGWTEHIKPIPVNFLGLYDAVEMVPQAPGTPDLGASIPPNVRHWYHAKKAAYIEGIFPTRNYGGDGNEANYHTSNRGKSSHGDIGTNNSNTAAHLHMIERARRAGVDLPGNLPKPKF